MTPPSFRELGHASAAIAHALRAYHARPERVGPGFGAQDRPMASICTSRIPLSPILVPNLPSSLCRLPTDNLQLPVRPTKIRVHRTKHTHKPGCSRSDGRATGRTRCISSKMASHYDDASGRRQSGLGRKDLIRAGIGWRSAVEFVPTALTVGHREISQVTLLFRLLWEGGLVAAIRTTPVARLKG